MKRIIALTLVVALSLVVVFAPMTASAGASTDAALALGAFAVLNQLFRGETIFNGWRSQQQVIVAPQPVYGYPQPDVVIMAPPAFLQPQVIWPSNCAPQWGTVYNDPYNPGIGRMVPTGLMECRWPNGATALFYQNGRPVPVPR